LINAPDAAAKSRALFAYFQGLMTQARIQNDLGVLREAVKSVYDFLGYKEPVAVTA
jgi:hypothetical protein